MLHQLVSLVILALIASLASAQALTTTVVDDNDPAIKYDSTKGAGDWDTSTTGWDTTKLRNGTLHRGLKKAHAQLSFTGTFVQVIVAVQDVPSTFANASFYIDGAERQEYGRQGSTANQLLYNITAFEASGLTNSNHVLDIVVGTGSKNAVYLDYIVYGAPTTTTSATRTRSSGVPSATATGSKAAEHATAKLSTVVIVVIGVLGGLIAILGANLLAWLRRRKRINFKRPKSSDAELLKFHFYASMPRERPLSESSRELPGSREMNTASEVSLVAKPHGQHSLQPPPPSAAFRDRTFDV